MKYIAAALLSAVVLSAQVEADESEVQAVGVDHELGRVFMSATERRQLDLLRKSLPATDRSAAVDGAAQLDSAPRKKKPSGVGYIVSPHGSPYQWIDGDFRRVDEGRIDAIDIPQSIGITHHEKGSISAKPGSEKPAKPQDDRGPDVEAGNANRDLQ